MTKTVTKAVTKIVLVTKTELSGEALRRHEACEALRSAVMSSEALRSSRVAVKSSDAR